MWIYTDTTVAEDLSIIFFSAYTRWTRGQWTFFTYYFTTFLTLQKWQHYEWMNVLMDVWLHESLMTILIFDKINSVDDS